MKNCMNISVGGQSVINEEKKIHVSVDAGCASSQVKTGQCGETAARAV